MEVATREQVTRVRRKAAESLIVYDLNTKIPMGQVLDMSERGIKLMTEEPVIIGKKYYCRLPFTKKINGQNEVFFDAECRWCRQNEQTGWYDSGYVLRYSSERNCSIVKELLKKWMVNEISRFNPQMKKKHTSRFRIFQKLLSIF